MPRHSTKMPVLEPISDEIVAQIARIIGGQSAATAALADAHARRARGETAQIFRAGSSFLVGPPLRPEVRSQPNRG